MYSKFTLNIYRMTDDPLEIVRTGGPFSSLGFRRTWRRSSAEVGGADGVYGFTSNRQNQTETKATLPD